MDVGRAPNDSEMAYLRLGIRKALKGSGQIEGASTAAVVDVIGSVHQFRPEICGSI